MNFDHIDISPFRHCNYFCDVIATFHGAEMNIHYTVGPKMYAPPP